MYNIYIGYDSSCYGQILAWNVCKRSILKHCSDISKINIIKLERKELIKMNIFKREDTDGSTEFTYTRFLIPYLNGYKGFAIFVDNDFLWNCDILELFQNYISIDLPLSCVKHKYIKCNGKKKMNGKLQTWYPKKNWSSLMIFNCEHYDIINNLTLNNVNTKSPQWLHRMQWCNEDNIIEIPKDYNYLVNYYTDSNIKALHFTDGGPWFKEYKNVIYSDRWLKYLSKEEREKLEIINT